MAHFTGSFLFAEAQAEQCPEQLLQLPEQPLLLLQPLHPPRAPLCFQ
jgi:hypothetical protein